MEDKNSVLAPGIEIDIPMFKGFWIRVLAALIDYLLISFGSLIIILIVVVFFGQILGVEGYILGFLLAWLLVVAIGIGYKPAMEASSFQGTFGKYFLGMKIVNREGHRITLKDSIIRYVIFLVSSGTHLLFLGSIMIGFDERKQGLHDMVADTYVVTKHHYGPVNLDGKSIFEKLNKTYVSVGAVFFLIMGVLLSSYGTSMTFESFEHIEEATSTEFDWRGADSASNNKMSIETHEWMGYEVFIKGNVTDEGKVTDEDCEKARSFVLESPDKENVFSLNCDDAGERTNEGFVKIGSFCDSPSCSDGTYTWDTDNNMVYVYDTGGSIYHWTQFSYLLNIGMILIGFSVGFLLTSIVMFVLIFFIKPKKEGETS
jgi:uncharacterized RDD family membrane protein YckC